MAKTLVRQREDLGNPGHFKRQSVFATSLSIVNQGP
jgi:hypothetical protein